MRAFQSHLKTQIPPLAPAGGEGSGVRGQASLKSAPAPAAPSPLTTDN